MLARLTTLSKQLAIYGLGDVATSIISFLLLPVMIQGAPKGMIYADCAETGGLQIEDAALALVRAIRNQVVMALRQSISP